MTTVKQYWTTLRNMSQTVSTRFGVDIRMSPIETRFVVALINFEVAMILKLLVTKGLVTDAEIQAVYVDARDNNTWESETFDPDQTAP